MSNHDLMKEGERALMENRCKDAIALMDRALRQNANDVGALYLKAQALSNSGDFQASLVEYDKLLQLVEDNPNWQADTLISKSDSLIELNRLDEAEECLDRALGTKPRLARAWIHKARIEARRESFQKSLEYCDRATAVNPRDPRGGNNRAYALYKLGRFKDCIKSAKKALSIKPDYAQAFAHMGQAYLQMGKTKQARKCEKKFREIAEQGGPTPGRTYGHEPRA